MNWKLADTPLLFRGRCKTPKPIVCALTEPMNECEASDSPPDMGGVAAPSRKRCETTAAAQTGWLGLPKCFGMRSLEEVPFLTTINASPYRARASRPAAPLKEASRLLLDVAPTPPMSGGEWHAQFIQRFIERAFLVILLILCFSSLVQAAEKVEIDNPWVRVIRITQAPHEKSERHARPASVSVYLTDLHQKVTDAGGKVRDLKKTAGDVAFFEAATTAEENVSDKPLEEIVVEIKSGTRQATGWPVALDAVKLDPEHHPVPFENDRVRILRTILDPHVKGPVHEHPSYVVVYLTELHTTMMLGDGRQIDNPRRPGEVAWRDALKHQTENIGEHRAVEIQIELKK